MTETSEQKTPVNRLDAEALARVIAESCWDAKALNVRIIDVRGRVSYADFVMVCHGTSERHAAAIADRVAHDLRPTMHRPRSVEGADRGEWILVDADDVILHVFNRPIRREIDIEGLFADLPRVSLTPPPDLEEDPRLGTR